MKTMLITGGARGLGRGAAQALAVAGHRVILTARSNAAGAEATDAIRRVAPDAVVEARVLDLASLADVRRFAQGIVDDGVTLDVVLHNAGIMQQSPERRLTADGLEETLGVNVVAPYLLTNLLWPALQRAKSARIVTVTSRLHLPDSRGVPVDFDFDDLHLLRGYDPERAYKNSKLAVLWFTYELARRTAMRSLTVNAVCPGFVPVTAAESTHGVTHFMLKHVLAHMPFARTVDEAVASYVFMATDPSLDGITGGFYGEMQPLVSSPDANDVEKARRFWHEAARLTGIDPAWPVID